MKEEPTNYSFTIGGTPTLKQDIISDNSFDIRVSRKTKTRLYLNLHKNMNSYSVNYLSTYAKENNLTFDSDTHANYISCGIETHHYFKLTKKQNIDVLKKHILSLSEDIIDNLLHIGDLVNKDTFEVNVYLPSDLK